MEHAMIVHCTKRIDWKISIQIFCHTMTIAFESHQALVIDWAMWTHHIFRSLSAKSNDSTSFHNRHTTHKHCTCSGNAFGRPIATWSFSSPRKSTIYQPQVTNASTTVSIKCFRSFRRTLADAWHPNSDCITRNRDDIDPFGILNTTIGLSKIARRT